MKSVILTKVNRVNLNFAQEIEARGRTSNDMVFLEKFVRHCHPGKGTEVVIGEDYVMVYTTKGTYSYTIYRDYILKQTGGNMIKASKKTFYKIS